jgi:alkanesulfonate monooxygenase SsuD/methylene tetrahydromethanopterin reductase-like flavin-dependent oxidoreductase (luciferase family)
VRLGVVILPERPWSEAAGIWRDAEGLGFAHAWTYDHLAWGALRDSAWFGAFPVLAAAATVTSHIRVGTMVASPNFRHPVALARDVLAIDDISNGPFELGVGAGGEGWDATMLGQQPWSRAERAARFAEFVELTDQLLTERALSYSGRYYQASEARSYPGCRQHPRVPFVVAGTRPRAMKVVARFGQAWVTTGPGTRHSNYRPPRVPGSSPISSSFSRKPAERSDETSRSFAVSPWPGLCSPRDCRPSKSSQTPWAATKR